MNYKMPRSAHLISLPNEQSQTKHESYKIRKQSEAVFKMSPSKVIDSPPPPYKNLKPSDEEASQIEAFWDRMRLSNPDWNKKPNLVFKFAPKSAPKFGRIWNLRRVFRGKPGWHATMSIWARNIPRLMRCGFYWSPADLFKGQGCILPRHDPGSGPDEHKRYYTFENRDPAQDWTARLCVFSNDALTVANFDLAWITMGTIMDVEAWNHQGHRVYRAPRGSKPGFNAIYDQMPMEGWWPWPKKLADEEDRWTTADEGNMVCGKDGNC